MKKLLCIFLTICLIITSVSIAVFNVYADEATDCTKLPTVYVGGQGQQLYDSDGNKIYSYIFPDGFAEEMAKDILSKYPKALLTQKWDDVLDSIYNYLIPIFGKVALDENGDNTNGSYNQWTWSREELNGNKVNGGYPVERYYFNYDWRIDPFVTARKLHDYIEDVLYVTGEEKVELIGRCLGASIANAYLYLYDGEYIDSYLQYASASQGAMIISKVYSGQLGLFPNEIEKRMIDKDIGLGEDLMDLVNAVITILNKTYGLDFICNLFNKTYNDIYMDIIPRLVGETYGTMPGYWSMVNDVDNCYEEAKRVLLYSRGYTDDSIMVKRIDDYHYNVQQKTDELFKRMETEKNIHITHIVKYGFVPHFFLKNCNMLNDSTCTVTATSYGATTSTVTGILPLYRLLWARIKGTSNYISPDLKIDASTCLCPDSTWFIKNLEHTDFPDSMNYMIATILNDNEITVNSYEEYPQFIVYNKTEDGEKYEKMTTENMFTDARYYTTLTGATVKLIRTLSKIVYHKIKG